MIDFLTEWWLEALLGGVLTGITVVLKHIYTRVQKEVAEQELLKQGMLAILHDRLYMVCQEYILVKKYCTIQDRNNLEHLFKPYTALKGNGTAKDLYEKCLQLPYEPQE